MPLMEGKTLVHQSCHIEFPVSVVMQPDMSENLDPLRPDKPQGLCDTKYPPMLRKGHRLR